jgi:hypothetical protein
LRAKEELKHVKGQNNARFGWNGTMFWGSDELFLKMSVKTAVVSKKPAKKLFEL